MKELIGQYLPEILTSIMTIMLSGQGLFLLIKNIKVNRDVGDVHNLMKSLEKGNLNVGKLVEKLLPELEKVTKEFVLTMVSQGQEILKDNEKIQREMLAMTEDFKKVLTEQQAVIHNQMVRLRKGQDDNDVSTL